MFEGASGFSPKLIAADGASRGRTTAIVIDQSGMQRQVCSTRRRSGVVPSTAAAVPRIAAAASIGYHLVSMFYGPLA